MNTKQAFHSKKNRGEAHGGRNADEQHLALAKAQKRLLSKQLRNAERVRSRLRLAPRQLTDDDLVQVLMMRRDKKSRMDPSTSAADPPTSHQMPATPPASNAAHGDHESAAATDAEEHVAAD